MTQAEAKKKQNNNKKINLFLRHFSWKQSYIFNVATRISDSRKVEMLITLKKTHDPWIVRILFFFFFLDAYLLFGDRQQLPVTAPASPRIRLT